MESVSMENVTMESVTMEKDVVPTQQSNNIYEPIKPMLWNIVIRHANIKKSLARWLGGGADRCKNGLRITYHKKYYNYGIYLI